MRKCVSRKGTILFLLLISCFTYFGCSKDGAGTGHSTALAKSESALSRENPFPAPESVNVVSVDEAFDQLKQQEQELETTLDDLTRLIQGISNDSAAEKVIRRLRDETNSLITDLDSNDQVNIYISYDDEDIWLQKARKYGELQYEKGKEVGKKLELAIKNILSVNLSHDVATRLGLAIVAYGEALPAWGKKNAGRVYYHYDPASIAYVVFEKTPQNSRHFRSALIEKIKATTGKKQLEAKSRNGQYWVKLLPVDDFDRLVNQITTGTQESLDADNQIAKFLLSASEIDALEKAGKQAEADQKKKVAERQRRREEESLERARNELRSYQERYENVIESLESIQSAGDVDFAAKEIVALTRTFEFENHRINQVGFGLSKEKKAELLSELDTSIKDYHTQIESELARILAASDMRRAYAKKIGSDINSAKRLLQWDGRPPTRMPHEDSSDPDYVVSNLEVFENGDVFASKKALQRLATVDPKSVDSQTRKQVAQALREKALEANAPELEDSIKALTNWGGKYSVPILIEMLGSSTGSLKKDALFQAIAKYPTKKGADAVAEYATDFFNGEQAINCLSKMGAVAEDALIRIAPANDFKVSRFAIKQLGEVGTSNALPILRKAKKSTNREIVELAKASIKQIEERESDE